MRAPVVWAILRKELLDSLRDRRTLVMMIGLPILLYPLLILGAVKLMETQREASEARASKIAVWGALPAALEARLRRIDKIEMTSGAGLPEDVRRRIESGDLKPPPPTPEPDPTQPPRKARIPSVPETPVTRVARELILARQLDAVIVAWPGLDQAAAGETLGHVSVLYDNVRPDSRLARDRLSKEILAWRKELVAERLRKRRLNEGFAVAVDYRSQNIDSGQRQTGNILGSALGFVLIFTSAMGGFYSAIDQTAGEKERGTMQTLLCAPVSPAEIIAGKFLAVWIIALLASLANIASMGAAFARLMAGQSAMQLTWSAYAMALLALVPVSFTMSALFLAVAAFAKDFKDGQNYITPLLMGLLLPLYVASLPGIELGAWTAFVPFVNLALLIKALFIAEAKPDAIFLTLVSSMAYAMLAMLLAARVFHRESVLLGGRESLRGLFTIERRPGATPTPSLALVVFSVFLVAAFYGSLLLRGRGLLAIILLVQVGFLLVPMLALIASLRFSWRETLLLRAPRPGALAASVLIGLTGWAAVSASLRLLPPPESFIKAMQRVLLIDDASTPLWLMWLLLAAAPAICEELFFRGFILSALRPLGMAPAIVVSSLLFALAHSSVYRLLPTMLLGMVIGYAVWRSGSIVCGMVIHGLNNAIGTGLARAGSMGRDTALDQITFLPWSLSLVGAAAVVLGVILLRRFTPRFAPLPSR